MSHSLPIIAVNYYFSSDELKNRIFFFENSANGKAQVMKAFREFMQVRGAEVVTLDTVDFADPNVKCVLYFDYNWRLVGTDPFLNKVPYEKRALVIIEPANINPSLYYTSLLRKKFRTVFTWDLRLLRKNPGYSRINVPVGAEPGAYRENRFSDIAFADKRFLVAVSRNRWSYMPQSTYALRKKAYRCFERRLPRDFDLFGQGWNRPAVFYEKWLGFSKFHSYRGEIPDSFDDKVKAMAAYRFALCFENNASEPGYISEKITDCFCARCVPVYYGSKGAEELIPRGAWIDLREFRDFKELGDYLEAMDETRYRQYIAAIDAFMASERLNFFSTDNWFRVIADRLGFEAPKNTTGASSEK